jgi:hypothetical protein
MHSNITNINSQLSGKIIAWQLPQELITRAIVNKGPCRAISCWGKGGGGGTLVGDNVVLKILFQTFSDLNFSEKSLIFNIFLNSSFLGAPLGMLGLLFYFSVGILHPLTPASSSGPALTNNSRNSWKVDEKCDHCSPQHQSTKMSVFLNSDRTRNLRHHNVTICAQPL